MYRFDAPRARGWGEVRRFSHSVEGLLRLRRVCLICGEVLTSIFLTLIYVNSCMLVVFVVWKCVVFESLLLNDGLMMSDNYISWTYSQCLKLCMSHINYRIK